MRTRAAVLAAALLIAAACSGDGGGQARTVDTAAPPDTAEKMTTTEERFAGDLASVVVQLDDLSTGWTVSPDEEEDPGEEECNGGNPEEDFPGTAQAESSFQQSDFGPFVGSSAVLFESASEADASFEEFVDALARCDGYTTTDEDGAETVYSVDPLSFPDLAEETFAARMSATTPFGPLNVDVALARQGPILLFLANGGFGAADSDLTEQLLRTMVSRV